MSSELNESEQKWNGTIDNRWIQVWANDTQYYIYIRNWVKLWRRCQLGDV